MLSCPITCSTRHFLEKSRAPAKHQASVPKLYLALELTAKALRWEALEELLSAIPSSNDDFGIT